MNHELPTNRPDTFDEYGYVKDEYNPNKKFGLLDEILNNQIAKITKQKDDFIKLKLIEKGFGHLVEWISKRRFPKICEVRQNGWSYIYADNDTDEGAFIVAIKDYDTSTSFNETNFSTQMNISFQWQDTLPLINSK